MDEIELNGDEILEWGFCQPGCPQEVAEIVCLDEPLLPDFVTEVDAQEGYANYSTNYKFEDQEVIREVGDCNFV